MMVIKGLIEIIRQQGRPQIATIVQCIPAEALPEQHRALPDQLARVPEPLTHTRRHWCGATRRRYLRVAIGGASLLS